MKFDNLKYMSYHKKQVLMRQQLDTADFRFSNEMPILKFFSEYVTISNTQRPNHFMCPRCKIYVNTQNLEK